MKATIYWRSAIALTAALMGTACGASTANMAAADDVEVLRERIIELEYANGRQRVALEEMEERIYLLQDRVEANRLVLQRNGSPASVRQAVTIGPPPRQGMANPYANPYAPAPSASAPAPTPNIDPMGMPELPVTRLGPAAGGTPQVAASPATDQWGASDEVVLTNETLAARFGGGTSSSSASSGASSSSSSSSTRVAQPPVDTRGHALPVQSDGPVSVRQVESPSEPRASVTPPTDDLTPLGRYRLALDQFNEGQYTVALENLNQFLNSGPTEDYMDNTLYWMGECYYGMGQYSDALGFFQRVVSEYPDGNKVPDSLLKVALSYERLNNVTSAREVLGVLAETYPTTDAARRATERLRALQ